MIAFIEKLNSEVLRSIERIESRDTDVLKKSLEASRVLGEAFDRLKQYIIGYRFQNDDEEIKFFKEIKPRLFCRLIYYRKLYNIEMNRPVGSIEAQREYLDAHVRAINAYTQKRLDFIRYFRSGATHLDSLYFLRGQTDTEQYLETFYYELDPQFSTNADFKVAKSWPTICCRFILWANWNHWRARTSGTWFCHCLTCVRHGRTRRRI